MAYKFKTKHSKILISYIMLTIGALLAAFALESFLVPNNILDGGITGISMILSHVFRLPLSIPVITLNIPFILIGFKNIGKRFLARTVYSITVFSVALNIFAKLLPITNEIILAIAFGGLLLGVGVGLIMRFGGCIDGTESVALVISKHSSLSVGQTVLLFNLLIYGVSSYFFGIDRALYSLLTYFITFKLIDFVSEGMEQAKAALIVTDKGTAISEEIVKRLGRTMTVLEGSGLTSGKKEVLYCVLTRIEVFELKNIAEEMDEDVFVTITDVSEIIGDFRHKNEKKRLV